MSSQVPAGGASKTPAQPAEQAPAQPDPKKAPRKQKGAPAAGTPASTAPGERDSTGRFVSREAESRSQQDATAGPGDSLGVMSDETGADRKLREFLGVEEDTGSTGEEEELRRLNMEEGRSDVPEPPGQDVQRRIKPIPDKKVAAAPAETPEQIIARAEEGDEFDELAPEAEQPKTPEQLAAEFEFGGEKFETREKAEQNFRTLRGQFRAMQTREQTARQSADAERARADHNDRSARAWKERAEGYESGATPQPQATGAPRQASQAGQAAGIPAGSQPVADLTPEQILETAVDWKVIGHAAQKEGPLVATYMALEGVTKKLMGHLTERFDAKLAQAIAPFTQFHQRLEVSSELSNLWSSMATYKYPNGQLAYPELADSDATAEIAKVWMEMGVPPESAMQHRIIHLAILAWRDMRRAQGKPWGPNGNAANAPNEPPTSAELLGGVAPNAGNGVAQAARQIAQELTDRAQSNPVAGGPVNQPRAARTPASGPQADLLRRLREAGKVRVPQFGVEE